MPLANSYTTKEKQITNKWFTISYK